ncbi:17624_t:CDS:2, partial [Cetraspora pellucida]
IVEQEKKKIEEASTTINLLDMIIETLPILITDISLKIIILPITLTLEIEINLETRIITTSTIIIDPEVKANLVIAHPSEPEQAPPVMTSSSTQTSDDLKQIIQLLQEQIKQQAQVIAMLQEQTQIYKAQAQIIAHLQNKMT